MQDLSDTSDFELKRLIKAHSEPRCGNCAFWMLKHKCKRENDHIVSMNERACGTFEIKQWYVDIIKRYERELVMRHI